MIFSAEYEICSCAHISFAQIKEVIVQNRLQTLGEIQSHLNIASGCKNCVCEEGDSGKIKKMIYCKDILNYYKDKA